MWCVCDGWIVVWCCVVVVDVVNLNWLCVFVVIILNRSNLCLFFLKFVCLFCFLCLIWCVRKCVLLRMCGICVICNVCCLFICCKVVGVIVWNLWWVVMRLLGCCSGSGCVNLIIGWLRSCGCLMVIVLWCVLCMSGMMMWVIGFVCMVMRIGCLMRMVWWCIVMWVLMICWFVRWIVFIIGCLVVVWMIIWGCLILGCDVVYVFNGVVNVFLWFNGEEIWELFVEGEIFWDEVKCCVGLCVLIWLMWFCVWWSGGCFDVLWCVLLCDVFYWLCWSECVLMIGGCECDV